MELLNEVPELQEIVIGTRLQTRGATLLFASIRAYSPSCNRLSSLVTNEHNSLMNGPRISSTPRYGGSFGPTERRRAEYKMPRFFKR